MKNSIEIERKYIIKMPDVSLMQAECEYTSSEILQIYLKSEKGITRRVRSRTSLGKTVYTETSKVRIDRISAIEKEREISSEEFFSLIKDIREGSAPIKKVRHTFKHGGQLFEIDVYPEWKKTAIMETELESAEKTVTMPRFIEIVREVSGLAEYSNSAMSVAFPAEDYL